MFIKREATERAIINYLNERDQQAGEPERQILNPAIAKLICDDVQNIRAIQVRPKEKWIDMFGMYRCPHCNHMEAKKRNFCEDCGADMRNERVLSCDRTKCHENEINDVPCEECECYSDTRGEE